MPIIKHVPKPHICDFPYDPPPETLYEPGSIWECGECGRRAVLVNDQRDGWLWRQGQPSISRGVLRQIDPRFHVEVTGEIVKSSNCLVVPENEPLMLFRARDNLALRALLAYEQACKDVGCTDYQIDGIRNRIEAFQEFWRGK